jgi:sugar phosphate isomerase/epimerase
LFSVSYAGYWGQDSLSLERFIPHAAKLGYEAVLFTGKRPHASPLDLPIGSNDKRVKSITTLLARHKVKCAGLGAYTDFSPARGTGIPSNEIQIAYVESLGRLAKAWGGRLVRVFTAYEHEPARTKALWEENVTALRECASRLADLGVQMAIQNHHDLGLESESLAELLSDIGHPNAKLSFDAWSLALRGEDLYAQAKKMAPHTLITTNADYIRIPRWQYKPEHTNYVRLQPDLVRAVPFGQGFIDYQGFFRGLTDGGFDGWANYEMCEKLRGGGAMKNLDSCARTYLDYMKKGGFIDP